MDPTWTNGDTTKAHEMLVSYRWRMIVEAEQCPTCEQLSVCMGMIKHLDEILTEKIRRN
jgi:hypothetical protein